LVSENTQTIDVLDIATRGEGAMVAAAMGDALGWPQEDRGGRVGGRRGVQTKLELVSWRRREGGRYASHETTLDAGAYSDDTQLALALCRCLLAGEGWWRRWTSIELPFWLLYERGGGGATKRAARNWAQATPPWTQDDATAYFNAGGNGVAMRVLPHAVYAAHDGNFSRTAVRIVADGVATHGHPRALVGALAAGYATWRALRREDRLGYGELVAETKRAVDVWSQLPALDDVAPGWRHAADRAADGAYEMLWGKTVSEMLELLAVAEDGMQQGTLAVDRDVLKLIGAYDASARGAGTVAAASSIFLGSRYASRPSQGLLAAAFAQGTDSDTIAAITGALLGAINGPDWLGTTARQIQDYDYIVSLTHKLATPTEGQVTAPSADPAAFGRFSRLMTSKQVGDTVELPDGRHATVEQVIQHATRTRNDIRTWMVVTTDGQTLFIKKIRKAGALRAESGEPPTTPPQAQQTETPMPHWPAHRTRRAVAGVEVADIAASVAFYRDLLGLTVTRETPEFVNLSGNLVLIASPRRRSRRSSTKPNFNANPRVIVFGERSEIETIRQGLLGADVPVSEIGDDRGRTSFRCLDPTGAVVEVREAAASAVEEEHGTSREPTPPRTSGPITTERPTASR
jgi:ADP-ribosylglycohydrolase/catechol 2,3-dioxygenase-like lactoylglutathione lyase family enzyme